MELIRAVMIVVFLLVGIGMAMTFYSQYDQGNPCDDQKCVEARAQGWSAISIIATVSILVVVVYFIYPIFSGGFG